MGKFAATEFVILVGMTEFPHSAEKLDGGESAMSWLRSSARRSPMEQPDR
jgi:hypothetical protein